MSLVTPELLAKASADMDTYTSSLIPSGKTGAAILVADLNGAEFGMAFKHGAHWTFDATLQQRWVRARPTAQFRVRATW